MLKNTAPVGLWAAFQSADRSAIMPTKPRFSMAKTKEKLAAFFAQNEAVRQLDEANKEKYPRMHQSVQGTAWQLLMYYIKNWGKPNAQNYEIRITYGYLRKALNESCCIATLKNHVNKLLKMYKGFVTEKYRAGLGFDHQNTPCIVLVLDPKVLQFEDERHNQAINEGITSAEQSRRIAAEKAQQARTATQGIITAKADMEATASKRMETPSSIGSIFQNLFGVAPKIE